MYVLQSYIDFGVTGNIDDQMLDDLLKKVDSLEIYLNKKLNIWKKN